MGDLNDAASDTETSIIEKLTEAGFTAEMLAEAETDPKMIAVMVEAARKHFMTIKRNPFKQTAEAQIAALRRANEEEGWGIADDVIDALAKTAPPWPKGPDSYRSFRLRFGEGAEGVSRTAKAHIVRLERLLGNMFQLRPQWRLGIERLHLLVGNETHRPVVEWVIIHLDAHRKRERVPNTYGPGLLADEGLVMAWLFPERLQAIDYHTWLPWFLAGYEIEVTRDVGGSFIACVPPCFVRGLKTVHLDAYERFRNSSMISVPVCEE